MNPIPPCVTRMRLSTLVMCMMIKYISYSNTPSTPQSTCIIWSPHFRNCVAPARLLSDLLFAQISLCVSVCVVRAHIIIVEYPSPRFHPFHLPFRNISIVTTASALERTSVKAMRLFVWGVPCGLHRCCRNPSAPSRYSIPMRLSTRIRVASFAPFTNFTQCAFPALNPYTHHSHPHLCIRSHEGFV